MTPQQSEPGFSPHLNWLGRNLDQLSARVNGTHGRLEGLGDRLTAAEARIHQLAETVAALDRRFTEVLNKAYDEDHPAALDTSYLEHQQLADDLDTLLSRIWQAVRESMKHADADRQAEAMAYTTRALWQLQIPRQYNELPHDVANCVNTCLDDFGPAVQLLMNRVGDLTTQDVFDFGRSSSAESDAQHQKPWGQCDPSGTVLFVVTPGYVVGAHVLLAQKVFTAPQEGS